MQRVCPAALVVRTPKPALQAMEVQEKMLLVLCGVCVCCGWVG